MNSRTPSPAMEIGMTWAIRTIGKNTINAVNPTAMPNAWAAMKAESTSTNW